ncbi:MAG: PEGA domain-containing protein [Byssovorax sp.]
MAVPDPSRRGGLLALLLALVAGSAPARAEEPPAAAADAEATTPAERLALAKDLFRKGVTLLQADDVERALEYFLRSRAAQASAKNTGNAAICLSRLGRYDEALEMYEELLLHFSTDLDAEDRATLVPAMSALRDAVGGVALSANVDGLVVIDGRARGKLPFSAPVRVLGGKHTIRIFKEGYVAYEARVDVPIRGTITVDALLAPLSGAGLLRVDDAANAGFEVVVDGATVGRVPWEGTLGLGRHLVWIRKGNRGSAPSSVAILEGQTALAQLPVSDLGPPLRIDTAPPTASLAIDGVILGRGSWEGRLPIGGHRVVGSEDGYYTRAIALVVQNSSLTSERVRVALVVDPGSSRWPRSSRGSPFGNLFGAYLVGASLRSDAERGCPARCSSATPVNGGLVGLRAGFRFNRGFAPELSIGFASFGAQLTRDERTTFYSRQARSTVTVSYELNDRLRVAGVFLGTGASTWIPLRYDVGFLARVTAGMLFARSMDPITGTATTDGQAKATITVSERDEALPKVIGFVLPELGAEARFGALRVGLTIGAAFFPALGPRFKHENTGVSPRCEASNPIAVGCAPTTNLLAGERAFGPFMLWSPQLSLGYAF